MADAEKNKTPKIPFLQRMMLKFAKSSGIVIDEGDIATGGAVLGTIALGALIYQRASGRSIFGFGGGSDTIKYSSSQDEDLFGDLMNCLQALGNDVQGSGLSGPDITHLWRGLHQWCLDWHPAVAENLRRKLLGTKLDEATKLIEALAQSVAFANQAQIAQSKDDPRNGRVMRTCVAIAKETKKFVTANGGDEQKGYEAMVAKMIRERQLVVPSHIQAADWVKQQSKALQEALEQSGKIEKWREDLDREKALQNNPWHKYGIPIGLAILLLIATGISTCQSSKVAPNKSVGVQVEEQCTNPDGSLNADGWCAFLKGHKKTSSGQQN